MAMLRKHLYRTLIKLGSKFDQNPRMKAFIFTGEARFPEFDENEREMKEDIHMEDVDTAMKEIIESICAPGSFYKPEVSLKEIVRISFRASPSKALDDNARNQLGFMAIRLLNNCEKLATELTYKGPTGGQAVQLHSRGEPLISAEINVALPLDASHIVTAASEGAITDYFQETDELKAGVLLVSHPLCVKYPISNAVCLVTHVSDDHSAGILLNKEFHVTFKSMLAKLERIRYGHYLKPFYDMPCFIGGEYEFDTHLNFCILHTQDSLAHLSHKIPLSGAIDIDTFFTPAVATQQDASASSVAVAAEPVADSVAQGSAQSAGAGAGESANYVYMSHDFASIGKELLSGNISETDLKVRTVI